MSYKLKSVEARSDGYYRFTFTPCSDEFAVDVPNDKIDEVFACLADINLLFPFRVEVRKRIESDTTGSRVREACEINFEGSENIWITDVVPVKKCDNEK